MLRDDVLHSRHLAADCLHRQAERHAFHQRVQALAQEPQARGGDEKADEKRGERVDGRPARHADHRAGHKRRDRAQQVAQDMQPGSTRVHVMAMRRNPAQHDDVERKADGGDRGRAGAVHFGGRPEPRQRLVADRRHDHQHGRGVEERREDLGPAEAVGMQARGRPARHPGRERAQPERGAVGEHVTGVGEQGERAGPPAAQRLEDGEANSQRGRGAQRRPGAMAMVVRMSVLTHGADFA
jgi:hypothetical protein